MIRSTIELLKIQNRLSRIWPVCLKKIAEVFFISSHPTSQNRIFKPFEMSHTILFSPIFNRTSFFTSATYPAMVWNLNLDENLSYSLFDSRNSKWTKTFLKALNISFEDGNEMTFETKKKKVAKMCKVFFEFVVKFIWECKKFSR